MKYDAFISYRHSELDMEIAKKIHSGLESYHVPKAVQKKSGKKSIKRVFRDQEELPIGSDLDDNISGALSNSEYLIVICSPRTPESYWVCKEIETFIEMHDRQHVLAVLIEGEPNESFPPLLLKDENGDPVEPLAADVRGVTSRERNKKLKTELLRLAAPLLGCSYDDLRQRHRERRIRRITTLVCSASAVLAVLGFGFAIYNAKMAAEIEKNYNEAVENYDLAVKNYDIAMENYEQAISNQYKYMADLSGSLLEEGYREDAVLLGLEAFSDKKAEGDKLYVPQAEYALSQALHTYETGNEMSKDGMLEHEVPVSDFRYDYDKCHLLTVEQDFFVCVWDVDTRKQIVRISPSDDCGTGFNSICAFEHIGDEIVIASNYSVSGFSMDGNELWRVDFERGEGALIDAEAGLTFVQSTNAIAVVDIKSHKITKQTSIGLEDAIYSDKMKFDAANGRLYVGCHGNNSNYIEVISISGEESKLLELPGDTLSEFTICENGDVISASFNSDEVLQMNSTYTTHVQRTGIDGEDKIWSRDFVQMMPDFANSSSTKLKYRKIQDDNGDWHPEVAYAENNQVACMNADTGDIISNFGMSGAVRSLLLSATGPLGYVALNTGNIDIIDLETGYIYATEAIETGLYIKDVCIANGVLAVRSYASPDVMLMKYHTGRSMEDLLSTDNSISQVYVSPDGRYLAVDVTEVGVNANIYIGDRESGEFSLIEVTEDECDNPQKMGFTPDGRFAMCGTEDRITYINPADLTKKTVQLDDISIIGFPEVHFSSDNKFVAIFKESAIYVYDMGEDKMIYANDDVGSEIIDVAINSNGQTYILTDNGKIFAIDTNSDDITPAIENITGDALADYDGQHIYLSNSGDVIALVSTDRMLRLIDIGKSERISENEFRATSNSFVYFSEDDSVIVTQDDDYYIRIYSTLDGENIYTSSIQYDKLIDVAENQDNDVVSITSIDSMLVLDRGSFVPVANINEGKLLTADGKVISAHYRSLYGFEYQTAESLIQDAKEQFGGTELSEAKKIKYHIGNNEAIVADMDKKEAVSK